MADEAQNIVLLGNQGDPVEFTISTGATIAKGSLMKLSASPQVVALATITSIFMGIAAEEKTAADGKTKITLYTHCLADLTCGAAETMVLGAPVQMGAASNEVTVASGDAVAQSALVVGIAQETVGGNGIGTVLINVGKQR